MRRSRWAQGFVVLALAVALSGSGAARAGDPPAEDLRDVVLRLTAENQLLVKRLERLEKRVAELEARLASAGEAKAAPAGKAPAGEPAAAAPVPAPAPAKAAPAEASGADDAQVVARLPRQRAFRHSLRITVDWMEVIARTLVRIVPHPVQVVSGPSDLALGALATYEGRACRKLPTSVQLDFATSDATWAKTDDRRVVFYVDKRRYDLGQASWTEERTSSGTRRVAMAVSVPLGTLLDVLGGAEIGGTLGRAEFVVPEATAEALRDVLYRLTPVK